MLAIAFAVVPATSCAIGPEVAPPPDVSANRRDGVCGELAHAFRLVGAAKDGGERREEQIERARESVTNPFVTDPDGTLEGLLEIIDLVYARPDLSAAEVEATVLDQCTIDDRGRVVVPKQWPVR